MRITVRLTETDLRHLDQYVQANALPSRSVAVQHAIRQLPQLALEDEYAQAWLEWEQSGDQELWEAIQFEGLGRDLGAPC